MTQRFTGEGGTPDMARSYTDTRNPLAVDEDYWIPVKPPSEPRFLTDDDIEHFRRRLFEAFRIPDDLLKRPR